MSGSLQLNRRFEDAVKNVVGEDQYYHLRKGKDGNPSKGFEDAKNFFNNLVKTEFRGDSDKSWFVNFPMAELEDDPANHINRNSWEMKRQVMLYIYWRLSWKVQV